MTREEAIFTIEHRDGIMDYGETEQLAEAIEVAIAVLKAEPCDTHKLDGMLEDAYEHGYEQARHDFEVQPCEDAISRKHLLSGIDELMQSPWFNSGKDDEKFAHYGYIERKEAVEIVRDLCVKTEPPVTPKPRAGHWVEIGDEPYDTWECDNCSFVIDGSGCVDPEEYRDIYKYCPNCGAKMEGESE